ncbi:o-acyltransferase [Anaeramoeba ignava]|uniref:O-acyltransferase n=1 Tax=Anaeramoeba ignava TaxID=1746090 RepID=A0A9Q0RAL4_ANAIG|nr:o-acyltransferase [Anaeramoeba ignava]
MKIKFILFLILISFLFNLQIIYTDPQECYSEIIHAFLLKDLPYSSELNDASSFVPNRLGNFGECENLTQIEVGRYVLVTATLGYDVFHSGICFPFNCSYDDLVANSENLVQLMSLPQGTQLQFQMYQKFKLSKSAGIMIGFTSILALLVILGTILEYQKNQKVEVFQKKLNINSHENEQNDEQETLLDKSKDTDEKIEFIYEEKKKPKKLFLFLAQFSVIKNYKQIFTQHPSSIKFLNFMRFLSMLWVILGHTYTTGLAVPVTDNLQQFSLWLKKFSFQVIPGAEFGVDTFFFLGGFLISFLLISHLEKTNKRMINFGKFYLHRIIRLLPVFTYVLFFSYTLAPYLGNGPVWPRTKNLLETNCKKYWWTNILFINNFYPKFMDQCMMHLWYIADDLQFYLITPFIVLAFVRKKWIGWTISIFLLVVSFIISIVLSTHYNLSLSFFSPNMEDYYNYYYEKPYTRLPSYLVGVFFAFFLSYSKFSPSKIKLSFIFRWSLFLLALFFISVTTFGTYSLYRKVTFDLNSGEIDWNFWSKTENCFYITFSKFTFCLGLAILSFLFMTPYFKYLVRFLSSDVWLPFSKLTYCAYVIHPTLITIFNGSRRLHFHYATYAMIIEYVTNVVFSYFFAFIIMILVELPFANLKNVFFSKF